MLETTRLILRPLSRSDASSLQTAANDPKIAETMISIPHPYPEGEAERYIQKQLAESQTVQAFGMEQKSQKRLCGVIELRSIEPEHAQAELSFWLIPELWGQGYMTEALQAVLKFGFEQLNLNRIYAYHMVKNPASGKLLQDNGFVQEGVLRQRVKKAGEFEDVKLWSILREDW